MTTHQARFHAGGAIPRRERRTRLALSAAAAGVMTRWGISHLTSRIWRTRVSAGSTPHQPAHKTRRRLQRVRVGEDRPTNRTQLNGEV
jgi:hypothetical protein